MKEEGYFKKENCRICQSTSIQKVVELTASPPGNNFLSLEQIGTQEKEYPLELDFCEACNHIQLGHVVDPKHLFQNNYSYVSGTSEVFVKHLKDYAEYVINLFDLKKSSLIVDIGSNDGTCLGFFKNKGMNVLGVDPATEIAKIASSKGINTIADFFSLELSKEIIEDYGYADLITSHNACAHIDDLHSVISGVEALIKDDGVFVMEVGYFLDVFENKWFDTIYHEHVDFHTVAPLVDLFEQFDMEMIRAERIAPQGGSIRVMAQKKNGSHKRDKSVSELISLEKDMGLNKAETLIDYEKQINEVRDKFIDLIHSIKDEGKTIAGFGAPTKATTLCYHFKINKNHIDFIVDDNPLKQGFYSPGKHIPVYDSSKIYEKEPDYVLILAWNFAESIMKKHQAFKDRGGSFIIPMPNPIIV